ncbi:MAG: cupin domain-containing protein [Planctomycetaceae bacterium]
MATHHAQSGEVVDVGPLGSTLRDHQTRALIKTEDLEVLRMIMPQGKELPTHRAPGRITVHCLEGRVAFTALHGTVDLEPGQLLYLEPEEPHSLLAHEDSSLLVTMMLPTS